MDSLELSGNPIAEPETKVISNKLEAVSSLLEITARNIVKNKIKVSPDDIFPRLMAYLGKGNLNEETNIFFCFLSNNLAWPINEVKLTSKPSVGT